MHNHRRSNVPVENTSARTAVRALGQRFLRDGPAFGARLGGSSRINHHDLAASIRSFVGGHRGQLSPRGVINMLRQHSASEAFRVEVFERDASEAIDELTAFFVQKVATGSTNVRLKLRGSGLALAADFRAALASGEGALQASELRGVTLRDIRTGDRLTIREGEKRGKAKINADAIGAGPVNGFDLDVKNDVPLARVAREDRRRWLARQLTMPADFDLAWDADKAELAVLADRQAVADAEVGSVVAVTGTEARKTRRLTSLATTEERLERLVELAKNLLLSRGRPAALVREVFADRRQRRDLVIAANADALLVSLDPMLKGTIVETAEVGEHLGQERGLRLVRLDPVSVAQYGHGLLALLVFDVLANGRLGNVTHGACEVGTRPQRRETRTQVRKLLTQKPGRRPLEAVNDLSRRTRRIGLDEQVNVVRHHFHFVNEKAVLGGNLVEQLLEPHINGWNKNGPPVLWTPHKVVLEAEHGSGVFGVSISRHTALYTRRTTNCQHLDERKGRASAAS